LLIGAGAEDPIARRAPCGVPELKIRECGGPPWEVPELKIRERTSSTLRNIDGGPPRRCQS
jgi:hypothetical protein